MAILYCRAAAGGLNNGSNWTDAYTNAQTAINAMARGDTLYIADGSYAPISLNKAGTTLTMIKKAIPADHGPGAGWSDSFGTGQAVIANPGSSFAALDFSSPGWLVDGQSGGGPGNWKGTGVPYGFKFTALNGNHPVDVGSSNNVTIKHWEGVGAGQNNPSTNDILGVGGADNLLVSYAYLHDSGDCIFKLSGTNLTFDFCFTGKYGDPTGVVHAELASIWAFSVTLGNMTFRNSIFTHIQSTGGFMWDNHLDHNAQIKLIGCVVFEDPANPWGDPANGVIGGWTGGNSEDCFNWRCYYTTFVNSSHKCFSDFITRSGNNEAGNNLFVDCSQVAYDDFPVHDFNHYVRSGGAHGESSGTSTEAAGSPFANPGTLATAYDFSLAANTSPGQAKGAGYDGATDLDMNGNVRTSRTRGAVEFAGSPPPPPPSAPIRGVVMA